MPIASLYYLSSSLVLQPQKEFQMFFSIDANNGVAIYEQIVRQVKFAIAEESLRPGQLLPSVRTLSVQLALNPNTIARIASWPRFGGLSGGDKSVSRRQTVDYRGPIAECSHRSFARGAVCFRDRRYRSKATEKAVANCQHGLVDRSVATNCLVSRVYSGVTMVHSNSIPSSSRKLP